MSRAQTFGPGDAAIACSAKALHPVRATANGSNAADEHTDASVGFHATFPRGAALVGGG